MENVICPNCGFQFPLDKSRDFCFCLKCGTKIEVPKYEEIQPEVQKVKPTEQPEVKNKTPKNGVYGGKYQSPLITSVRNLRRSAVRIR